MGTTRLQFKSDTPKILQLGEAQAVQEIEVPAGESHFRFLPAKNSDQNWQQDFIFHIRHPQSRLLLTGFVEARGESASRLRTTVIHHVGQTQAETLLRTLAYDNSAPRYEGTIKILPEAQGVESYLNHHSLLLGTPAKSWTRPSLESDADQVKCSHAATIRTSTDADLFYLRSRGLDPATAKELLIKAFLADVSNPAPTS